MTWIQMEINDGAGPAGFDLDGHCCNCGGPIESGCVTMFCDDEPSDEFCSWGCTAAYAAATALIGGPGDIEDEPQAGKWRILSP